MHQKVPRIIHQSLKNVIYEVPSKSEPGLTHITEFKPSGKRDCRCPGVMWFKKKDEDHMKMCRHQKMTTIQVIEGAGDPKGMLDTAVQLIRKKDIALFVPLNYIKCQYPENYKETAVHCEKCPMYPRVCNIHKIKINHRGKLPLVWKLQSLVYDGKRKTAKKVLVRIRRASKNIRRAQG